VSLSKGRLGPATQIPAMSRVFKVISLASAALIAGCASSPQARIDADRARYESYSLEARERINAGRIDLGFTPDMVRMALGEPSRVVERRAENETTEVWVYTRNRPRFGIGLGIGSWGGRTSVGTSVGMSTGGWGPDEVLRVEFRDGVVTAVDERSR